jgi:hypothetical protein
MRRSIFGLAIAAFAVLTPVTGMANDQQIADYVKGRLAVEQQNGNLRGFNVDMRVENGTIWLSGQVSTAAQEKLILETAQQASYLGAKQVVDDIDVRSSGSVMQASMPMAANRQMASQVGYQEAESGPAPAAMPGYGAPPMMMQGAPMQQSGYQAQQVSAPMPMPMGYGGGSPAANAGQPNMPGYAWPGYAASPNYAAVNYPQQYSASAWPYIGPFYPYPQVPMGWRRVELEWDDGWWNLDFHDR